MGERRQLRGNGDREGGLETGTVTRRDLVSWLGRAATASLFAPWIAACVGSSRQSLSLDGVLGDPGGADEGGDAARLAPGTEDLQRGDTSPEDPSTVDVPSPGACDPTVAPGPGEHPVFRGWGERTVDPQDLSSLLATWRLTIGGMVRREVVLDFCTIREMGLVDQVTDFHCVEGWSILDVPWNGVPLGRILDRAAPHSEARFLKITSVGGRYTESLPVSVAYEPKTLLALGIGGNLLPLRHGFPARIVVPRLLGYKNPKYVTRIDLTDVEHTGFWPRFGYSVSGEVPRERLREGRY